MSIEELANEFRKALDIIKIQGPHAGIYNYRFFPRGFCGPASDLLAEYLMANGIKKERIQQVACSRCAGGYSHRWLVIDGVLNVDITADQFNGKAHFKEFEPIPKCCLVSTNTYIYTLFDVRREDYTHNVGIDSYGSDMCCKLRVIYDAALQIITNEIREG